MLSAMAHGQDGIDSALSIALAAMAASVGLEPERSMLYCDLILASLSEATRKALLAMDPAKYEFQSEFAQRLLSQGRAEGRTEGRAEGRTEGRAEGEAMVLIKLLTLKFGQLSPALVEQIRGASLEELDLWTSRVLTATALTEVLR